MADTPTKPLTAAERCHAAANQVLDVAALIGCAKEVAERLGEESGRDDEDRVYRVLMVALERLDAIGELLTGGGAA